jgi:transcription antitermination protein NusB
MHKQTRHNARILAFRLIYCRNKLGISPTGEKNLLNESDLQGKYKDFSQELAEKTWAHLDQIDPIIQSKLKNWKQHRISDTLNALLRISICELLFYPDTETKIIINEAIELCKIHVDEKATRMCNGVLHAASSEIRVEQPGEKIG